MSNYYLLDNDNIAEVLDNHYNPMFYPQEGEQIGYSVNIYDSYSELLDLDPNFIADSPADAVEPAGRIKVNLGEYYSIEDCLEAIGDLEVWNDNYVRKAAEYIQEHEGQKNTVYDNDGIKVSTTGHDSDFIATVENNTNSPVSFEFEHIGIDGNLEAESFSVEAHDWCGIEANQDGYITLAAFMNDQVDIEFEEPSLDDMLAAAEARGAQANDDLKSKSHDEIESSI